MFGGIKLSDKVMVVEAFAPATPSTASPNWISLKDARSVQVVIQVDNAATVTGSAVALSQATAVAGTSAKALAFSTALRNVDTAAGQGALTAFTVASNTFTTDNTNNKNLLYVIDVDPTTLDTANNFDCVRVTLGNATNAVVSALYVIEPHYSGNAATMPTVTSD